MHIREVISFNNNQSRLIVITPQTNQTKVLWFILFGAIFFGKEGSTRTQNVQAIKKTTVVLLLQSVQNS